MAALVNGDILRVRVYNEDPGRAQVAINTYYVQISSIVGPVNDFDVAGRLAFLHAPLWRGWQSSRTRYKGSGVARVSPNPTPEFFENSEAGAGTLGTVTLPTQVTGLIAAKPDFYHTGSFTTKHPLGTQQLAVARMYISFPSSTNLQATTVAADGRMSVGAYNSLVLMAKLVYEATSFVVGGGLSWVLSPVVRSKKTNFLLTPPVSVISYYPLTKKGASPLWATQKGRGDRGHQELFAIGG